MLRPALQELPDDPRLKEALRRVEEGRTREKGRGELDRLRMAASGMAASGRPEDGLRLIEQNRKRFASEPSWLVLLDQETEEIRQMARMAAVGRWRTKIDDLLSAGKCAEALSEAENALRDLPGEAILLALQQQATVALERQRSEAATQSATAAATRERQRRDALTDLLSKARMEAGRREFAAALHTLDSQAHEYGSDLSWQECRTFVEKKRRQAEQRDFVESTQQRLQSYVDQGKYVEAIQETERALERFPNDTELNALRENARQMLRRQEELERQRTQDEQERSDQERLQAMAAVQMRARKALQRKNFSEALTVLDSEVGRFGTASSWQQLRAEIVQAEHEARKAEALKRVRVQVQQLLSAGSCPEAAEVVERVKAQYPDEPETAALSEEIAKASQSTRTKAETEVIGPSAEPMSFWKNPWKLAVAGGVALVAFAGWMLRPGDVPVALEANPARMEFRWKDKKGATPQQIVVRSNRETMLKVTNGSKYLDVSPMGGKSPLTLNVALKTQAAPAGSNDTESFRVETPDGKSGTSVNVHLEAVKGGVVAVPVGTKDSHPAAVTLSVNPARLEFRWDPKKSAPPGQVFTIASNISGTHVRVTSGNPRVSVTPAEGTVRSM